MTPLASQEVLTPGGGGGGTHSEPPWQWRACTEEPPATVDTRMPEGSRPTVKPIDTPCTLVRPVSCHPAPSAPGARAAETGG